MIGTKQEILDRYAKVEKAADKFGRIITIGKLKPSQGLAVIRLADTKDDYVQFVSRVAASVRMIDEAIYAFPRDAAELNSIIDVLDKEGMDAAGEAFLKLHSAEAGASEDNSPKA
jgi:hypothetical protein